MASSALLLLLLAASADAFQASRKAVVSKHRGSIPGLDDIADDIDSAVESTGKAVDTATSAVDSVADGLKGAVDKVSNTLNDTMNNVKDIFGGSNGSAAATNNTNATGAVPPLPAVLDPLAADFIAANMSAAEVSAGVAKKAAAELVKARAAYAEAEANASKAAAVGLAAAKVLAVRANETTEDSNAVIEVLSNEMSGALKDRSAVVNSSIAASKSADAAVSAAGLAVVAVTEYQTFKEEADQAKQVSLEAAKLVADSVEKTMASSRGAEAALQEQLTIFEDSAEAETQDLIMNLTKSAACKGPLLPLGTAVALALTMATHAQL